MQYHDLQKAAELVEGVAGQLNTNETPACPCCGVSRKVNMEEYRVSEELMATAKKLKKLFVRLDEGGSNG
jgi:hypothetical protein